MQIKIKKVHYENLSYMGHNYKDADKYSYKDSDAIVKNGKIEFVHGGDGFEELYKYVFDLFKDKNSNNSC